MFHVTFGATLTICSDLLCLGQVHSFHSSLSEGQCAQRLPTSMPSRYAGVLKIVNLLAFWNWHQIESESERDKEKHKKVTHNQFHLPSPTRSTDRLFARVRRLSAFRLHQNATNPSPPPVFAHTIHSYRPLLGPVWPFFGI